MGVYSYVPREQADQDMEGTFVPTKWVRIDKGTPASPKVRYRLLAQELAFGKTRDELFLSTPSLSAVTMALGHAAHDSSETLRTEERDIQETSL